jgi:transaldolase
LKIFLDTANLKEIKEANEMGLIDGVTTNPSLLSKEGGDPYKLLKEICEEVDGPVSAEVIATDAKGMVEDAQKLIKIHSNIVIKIPLTKEGLKATSELNALGIPVNQTLIFSPLQALLAAKAGARYVSPFVGRLDDISHSGMDLVQQIIRIFDNYRYETEIIVASIRHPVHVVDAALMGADIATVPFKVLEQFTKHPLTDIGIQRFLDDWNKLKR